MNYGGENWGKWGEAVVGFSPVTNSISLLGLRSTEQSFIKIEREL